jgi:hypothetical protein
MHLKPIAVLLVAVTLSISARAQPSCGDPPRVDDQTLKGDLEGKAQFLSKLVGDANLKGQIEAARTDVFSKYPNAGQAHSDAYLEYMFCSFVLSDPKLTAQEKLAAILEFRQAEREPASHGAQSTTVIGAPGGVTAGGNVVGSPVTNNSSPGGAAAPAAKP